MNIPNLNPKRSGWVLTLALLLTVSAHGQQSSNRQIVISLQDRKLALVENGDVIRVYPVAVGKRSTPSPTGEFKIVNRLSKPTYYRKGMVVEPGPKNPVGTRWMGLDRKGYGIHGTNEPKSIGKAASHGCIRMGTQDLEDLFTRVKVGDTVEIVGERDEQTAKLFGGEAQVITASAAAPASAMPVVPVASTTGQ